MRKAFVLLSGGLDSTTCLSQAIYDYCPKDMAHMYGDASILQDMIDENWAQPIYEPPKHTFEWVEAVSIYYGQRHKKELDYAKKTCEAHGIKHTILDVGNLLRGDSIMLTDDSRDKLQVPDVSYADIKGVSPTYVPFRNGLMLSALTAHAQKWVDAENKKWDEQLDLRNQADGLESTKPMAGIYFGAHSEDAHNWAYPDCTPEFIGAMANAIYIGSYMQIRLHTPLQWLNKTGVVELGNKLGVRFKQTWSCYKGEEKHCGTCPTCLSRKEAFKAAGIEDPTEYLA